MSFLGKQVRMNRLFSQGSDKILVVALDHAIGWGILPGIDKIQETLDKIVGAGIDAVTMMKGTLQLCFPRYAGKIPFILKSTTFSPFQPTYDALVADVEEAVRLGADAIAVGATLGGANQFELLKQLGQMTKAAESFGMPTVAHIYPKGESIKENEKYSAKWVSYAARAGAELGVDIIKTFYTGSPETYREVVVACPAKLVVSGGPKLPSARDLFQMTKDVIDVGAAGVTYGRNVWQADNPVLMVKALKHIIHDHGTVEEAMAIWLGNKSEQGKILRK